MSQVDTTLVSCLPNVYGPRIGGLQGGHEDHFGYLALSRISQVRG